MEGLGSPQVYTLDKLFAEVEQGELAVAPGTKLTVLSGQKIRLTATIQHFGAAVSATFYAALGNRGVLGFDEWRVGRKSVSFTQDTTWKSYTLTVDIDTTGLGNETNADLYCKLLEYPDAGMPEVDNVVDIIAAAFQNFAITDYSVVP